MTFILFVSSLSFVWRHPAKSEIQITEVTQLTDDGTYKRNLVTDGKQLYFGEAAGTRRLLSAVPVGGGPIRQIAVPFPNPYPTDISPDGRYLLVRSGEDTGEEHPLWIVPTSGATPHQLAGLRCTAAAWAPNGNWIAYAFNEGIYLISPDGLNSHLLSRFDGIPETLLWSANGKRLLIYLRSLAKDSTSLWQMDLDTNVKADRVALVHTTGESCCRREFLAQGAGAYFSIANDSPDDHLLALRPSRSGRGEELDASPLNTQFKTIQGFAARADTCTLFILSGGWGRGELVRYDGSTHGFTMMLPGASATYVDFSRDVAWTTYVRTPTGDLWVSRPDGSDARRLSPSGMQVQLPRWSPDGKWIAFMAKQPDRPFRIFVVSAMGGAAKEASQGNDSQGAPTWSPDGTTLVYGNVKCQEEHTCAIHEIDLASGATTTLPDSQGLGTARWSPDGHHIAALNPTRQQLTVFDMDSQQWRTLASGINGNDISWSSDSRYIYTKRSLNGQTEIVRVPVRGGTLQTVMNLDLFSKSTGELDVWFSLTPDNALILNRSLDTSEIFALNYKLR